MENIKEMSTKLAQIEAKIDKNVPQSELVFDVDKEEEIDGIQMGVLTSGTPYLTQTGLAKLCGIDRKEIYRIQEEISQPSEKIKIQKIISLLKQQGYNETDLFIRVHRGNIVPYNAYPDLVCMALLEYFAFEAPNLVERGAKKL